MALITLLQSTINYAEYSISGELSIYEFENMHAHGLEVVLLDQMNGVVLVKLTYPNQSPYSLTL